VWRRDHEKGIFGSEVGRAAKARIQPILDEMNNVGTITADPYVGWLVY
jgi:hypothetical protein